MTMTLSYAPADPAAVAAVTRLRLYTTDARTDPPVVDVGPAVAGPSDTWDFTFPDQAAGVYYARVDLDLVAGGTGQDADDTITLPLPSAVSGSGPLAPWVLTTDITGTDASDAQLAAAAAMATEVLYALSGRRWPGLRSDRLRLTPGAVGFVVSWPSSVGLWTPGRTRGCGCHSSRLNPQLPGPISRVVRLTVGGVDVPAAQISVEDRHTIRLAPGDDPDTDPLAGLGLWVDGDGFYALWPSAVCGCGQSNSVELVVEWGTAPTEAGAAAALQLATEIAKGLSGGNCRIAGNVTSVNRQGVSVLLDPTTFLDKGRTGVPLVDLWLQAANPNRLQRAPEVWFPEAGDVVRLS